MTRTPRPGGSFERLWAAVQPLDTEDYAAAEQWWVDARADLDALCAASGLPYERMAYVVAVASPGVPWRACLQNVRVLVGAMQRGEEMPSGPGCGLEIAVGRRHLVKAWAILHDERNVTLCRGPKVEAFAANLLGDFTRVTVDRHITMAACGDPRQRSRNESARIALMVTLIGYSKHIPAAYIATALWMRAARNRATARVA